MTKESSITLDLTTLKQQWKYIALTKLATSNNHPKKTNLIEHNKHQIVKRYSCLLNDNKYVYIDSDCSLFKLDHQIHQSKTLDLSTLNPNTLLISHTEQASKENSFLLKTSLDFFQKLKALKKPHLKLVDKTNHDTAYFSLKWSFDITLIT